MNDPHQTENHSSINWSKQCYFSPPCSFGRKDVQVNELRQISLQNPVLSKPAPGQSLYVFGTSEEGEVTLLSTPLMGKSLYASRLLLTFRHTLMISCRGKPVKRTSKIKGYGISSVRSTGFQ